MKFITKKLFLSAALLGLFTLFMGSVPASSYASNHDKDMDKMKEQTVEVYKGSTWSPEKIRDAVVKEKMTGHKALSPEQSKLLQKNKPIDKSLKKEPIDNKLKHCLPNYAEHNWYIVGEDMVLVNNNNDEVVEIVYGVFK